MSAASTNANLIQDIETQNVRHLRQAQRRGLSIIVNLIANGRVSHVTLENVSNTGLGLRGDFDVGDATEVQVQFPNGRMVAALVCWVRAGRLGTKLVTRLQKDDPLLNSGDALAFSDPIPTRPTGAVMVVPFQFGSRAMSSTGSRILVGDGFRSICFLLKGILEKAGNVVDFVETGLAVVEAARLKRYDVVLVDSQIPLMSIDVVTSQIRRLPAPFNDCSIITVVTEMPESVQVLDQGAMVDGYLTKPIHPAQLLEVVAAVQASGATETTVRLRA